MKKDFSNYSFGSAHIDSGETHVHVSHGLGSAPTSILVTPRDDCLAPVEVPSASISATEFVVQFSEGVTLGADASFYWMAIL